jgi:hypothetical protein
MTINILMILINTSNILSFDLYIYIMKMLKDLQKTIKAHHLLALVAGGILIYITIQYSNRKGMSMDGMNNNNRDSTPTPAVTQDIAPSKPLGQNETYASVSGGETNSSVPSGCSSQPTLDPSEMLPKDENSQWAKLNPRGTGGLDNVNLLQSGWQNGINTIGSSLRNANLQIRSEEPNPQVQVSPWGNTTISPSMPHNPKGLCS